MKNARQMVAGQAGMAGLKKLALKRVPKTVISGRKLWPFFWIVVLVT